MYIYELSIPIFRPDNSRCMRFWRSKLALSKLYFTFVFFQLKLCYLIYESTFFRAWDEGYPNDSEGGCLYIQKNGTFRNGNCDDIKTHICKRPMGKAYIMFILYQD